MASPQYRYADGVIYRRDPTPYSYDLRIHDLGGRGQVEALAMPRYAWTELDATPEALSRAADAQGNVGDSLLVRVPSTSCGRDLEERAAANRNVLPVVQRLVRRLIKAKNLDTMLTRRIGKT